MELGRDLKKRIKSKIEKTFVGTCHPEYGYIILLLSKEDQEKYWQIGDGHIQDTTGDVIFKVSFRAIACMPEPDEVLDGKVVEVSHSGIHVQSGPVKTFIPMKKDRGDYNYDQTSNTWIQKDEFMDKKLEKGVHVRYRITTLKYLNNDFSVVGKIDEDYLG